MSPVVERPSLRRIASILIIAAWVVGAAAPVPAAETVRVGGTGIGLGLMRIVGDEVAALTPDLRTEVLPSLGTPGGIKALLAGDVDVAIAARDVRPDEQAKGLRAGACMTTALIFATSHTRSFGLTRAQLPQLFADPNPRWPDGTPMKIILRSRAGSENPYLIEAVPGLEAAFAIAYKRPGIPIGATDQENVELAQRTVGSLAIATLLQIRTERLQLLPLPLDGVEPSARTLADRSYPMPIGLCIVVPASPTPGAARLVEYLLSPSGRTLARTFGAEPRY